VTRLRQTQAAAPCALYKLDGWSSLRMAPVDIMHTVDLGLCKRFWVETLVGSQLLDGGDLQRCHAVLSGITYPTGVTKIASTLGGEGGNAPTAAGWSVLARYILPALLLLVWDLRGQGATKTFSSNKRYLTGDTTSDGQIISRRVDKVQRKRKKRKGNVGGTGSSSAAAEQDEAGGHAPASDEELAIVQKTEKVYRRSVTLLRIVEAAFHLGLGTRFAHATSLREHQVNALHQHLLGFIEIMTSDIHHNWLTYNSHIVLHMAHQIRLHGPPRAYWAYQQERMYGLMKQVKTNRHRNGEIENTLRSRINDRHRIATISARLPDTALAREFQKVIKQREVEDKEELENDERESVEPIEDEGSMQGTQATTTAQEEPNARLSPADLEATCVLANAHRRPTEPQFVSAATWDASVDQNLLGTAITRSNTLRVGAHVLSQRHARHVQRSDPFACVIKREGSRTLARFDHAFKISYHDAASGSKQTLSFVVVHALSSNVNTAAAPILPSLWPEMGYVFGVTSEKQRVIVTPRDIEGAAITIPCDILGPTAASLIIGIKM